MCIMLMHCFGEEYRQEEECLSNIARQFDAEYSTKMQHESVPLLPALPAEGCKMPSGMIARGSMIAYNTLHLLNILKRSQPLSLAALRN